MPGQFGKITGDAGQVLAMGAKVGIISSWVVEPRRMKADGTPELQFRCQFRWKNDVTMGMINRGVLKGRVQVTMKTKKGIETIDIVHWEQWRLDGGILYLDNIMYFDATALKERIVR
jgi:hypothetical protein